MARISARLLHIALALCMSVQGALLWRSAGGVEEPGPGGHILLLVFTLLALGLCGLLLRRADGRRVVLSLTALLQFLLLFPIVVSERLDSGDDGTWLADRRIELSRAMSLREGQLREGILGSGDWQMPESLLEPDVEPFGMLQQLVRVVEREAPDFPVALALWRGDERIAWNEGALPLPPSTILEPELSRSGEDWIWRRFLDIVPATGDSLRLEIQRHLVLTRPGPPGAGAWADWRGGHPFVRTNVLEEDGPARRRWWGDAERGVQLTVDVVLSPNESGRGARLRLAAVCPPRQALVNLTAARMCFWMLLLWGLSLCTWACCCGRRIALVLTFGLVRMYWLGVDIFRWLQGPAVNIGLESIPEKPASLLDSAYFAIPNGGEWFSSTAEAMLTLLVFVAVAWLLSGWLAPRVESPRPDARRRLVLAFLFGLVAAACLGAVRAVIGDVVVNSNPRLIGARVPVEWWTFWTLHLLVLLACGSVLRMLTVCADRCRGRVYRTIDGVLVLLAALTLIFVWPDVPTLTRVAAALVSAGIWLAGSGSGDEQAGGRSPRLRTAILAPLLLTVLWNYLCLSEAYRGIEQDWLERKADQIVESRDEIIALDLEDALAEMGVVGAADTKVPPHSPLADRLWRNRTAYDLWESSAIHDLARPCLVEIIDADGRTESLFASGFLRDFSYEVLSRSDWDEVTTPVGEVAEMIVVQSESRRYPTGEEEILRGEVARRRAPGWIRLELPVRSRRLSTLLTRLSGAPVTPGSEGYRPRSDVDYPPLLVRGDSTGWLDAGPGGYPDEASRRSLAMLRQGLVDHSLVTVDGVGYRCVWREVPAGLGGRPGEGFLLGVPRLPLLDRVLDLSRLALIYMAILSVPLAVAGLSRLLRQRRLPHLGFQERFLAGYLVLGLMLLLLAGMFIDNRTLAGIVTDARHQTREGLTSALGQLQGMLAEQGRSLAASDYVADLLRNRLAGQRTVGPFALRQGMVFSGDGELLLDETLSDLSPREAADLLDAARSAPLIVIDEGSVVYLGTVIPIDLSGVLDTDDYMGVGEARDRRLADGFFFYRQRVDDDLVAGLAEIIQGEITLRVGGEAVLASHPERVFSGRVPVLAPPAMVRNLQHLPASPVLFRGESTQLDLTGCVALPSLRGDDSGLSRRRNPAVLSVDFPARRMEFSDRRRETVLFLAGLASLILMMTTLLTIMLTWNVFGPVRMLVTATRRLAAGDFQAPLPGAGPDEMGLLAGAFAGMRDKLSRARAELAERERFLTTVLDRVPVGVAVFDPEDRRVELNPAARAILNQMGSDENEGTAWLLAGARRQLAPYQMGEGELVDEEDRLTLRFRLAPLDQPDGRRDTLIVFEDITEFLATKRLALNAEMARQVAHEIKNPLTPIQLSVQFLQQASRDSSPELDRIVDTTVRQVLEQVSLLRSIATEFSLLGRPGDLECRPLDFVELVGRVISGYVAGDMDGDTAGPRVEMVDTDVPAALGHEESLVKILGNLMQNSIDACGGPEDLRLRITWESSESDVCLSWTDNGAGLAPDVAEHLFDPYFSTKSKGTGLGLAICRNLVDKMGGRLTLENRPGGEGAVARLVLPRASVDGETDNHA